tara:strand:- start:5418 stop:5711 length:294 start_codon:yes stop_codon:yes gene_type:complete
MKLKEFNEMMKNSFGDRVVNIPSKTDNQIIAEFMLEETMPINQMMYDKSWDWLMPVMAKLVENFGSGWKFEQGYNLNVRYKEVVKFIKEENEDKLCK